ncbi:MAG: RagB/SusD family nutrient uptake outer membrane protein [Prevotella sp.]|nr:RagB/SusD family nutrient uptake outer membrane protein [Prevotella sp.]
MKKIIFSMLALVAGGTALTSCGDKLDIEQKGVIAIDNFYETDADVEKALAAAYENFQGNTMGRAMGPGIYTPARVLANHPGDDICYGSEYYGDHEFGGSVNEFRFLHTPEAIIYHYKGLFLSVYADNLVIEQFQDLSTPMRKKAVAEARVLRAYNYLLLVNYWGTPPFVDHVLNASETPTNSNAEGAPENAPKTQQDYYKWIANECLAVVGDLSERASTDDKDGAYRVTKGFAYALAGKALMFAEDFAGAKDALKKVIDSGKYALVPGDQFMDQFHIQGDGSPEKVFEVNIRYNANAGEWSSGSGWGWNNHSTWMESNSFQIRSDKFKKPPLQAYTGSVQGWGSIGLPEWYGQAFFENDGKDSKRLQATMVHIDDLIYGETGIELIDTYYGKLAEMSHDEKVKNDKIGIKPGRRGHYGQSFWIPIKHVIRVGDAEEEGGSYGSGHRLNNIIIMRYAEVLLNYAECCCRTGATDEAKKYVNMIQERAGSKTISSTVDLETVKKEKAWELWFEGCRYQDLMRWSKLGDTDTFTKEGMEHLKGQGKHVPNLCDKLSESPTEVEANWEDLVWENGSEANSRFFIIHTHDAMDAHYEVGWQEKHRLFPYPQTLMDNNPALHQNPGWE